MKEYDLQKLINNPELVEEKIKKFLEDKALFKQDIDKEEIKGHILKSEHNSNASINYRSPIPALKDRVLRLALLLMHSRN